MEQAFYVSEFQSKSPFRNVGLAQFWYDKRNVRTAMDDY